MTEVTEHGGSLEEGTSVTEKARRTGADTTYKVDNNKEYENNLLDRSIVNRQQIRQVLETFKNAIYTDLSPEREKYLEYVPKTLIFAKNDNHATEIVEAVKDVFKDEFPNNEVPEHFVQKITYSSDDSNGLIRDLRNEKNFRIAVTVTLVATGTDVKPLEVVLFMKDVMSDVLYTQRRDAAAVSLLTISCVRSLPMQIQRNATTLSMLSALLNMISIFRGQAPDPVLLSEKSHWNSFSKGCLIMS